MSQSQISGGNIPAMYGLPPQAPEYEPAIKLNEVLQERKKQHGDFRIQFQIAQALKKALGHYQPHLSDIQCEAIEQICHKLSRVVTGDANYADHWRDIAGYATLITNMLER